MSTTTAIVVGVVLLLANAFFVGAEFALISARRSQIEPLAAAGSRRARITLRAMEQVSLMMACAQLGITACSLGLGAVGEPAVAQLVQPVFDAAGLPSQLVRPVSFTIALVVVVCLHMVLGEMMPKNIAIAVPERAALWLGPPLAAVTIALRPVIVALNAAANGVLRLMRVPPRYEVVAAYTVDQVADLVTESRRAGLLALDEYYLLAGALSLQGQTVATVLLPLPALVTVPATATAADVQDLCARTGYSRFPVTGRDGQLVGYVHIKDLLARNAQAITPTQVRPFATLAATEPLHAALARMQAAGAHLARVQDDSGRTIGLVALEDVLEQLVGEVRDGTQPVA